jgi:hypothetical protein
MLTATDFIALASVSFLASFLGSYVRRKGENLATKEDVAEITRKQDEVHNEFQKLREQSTQRHQLRLAALDERLAAHQKAYSLWRNLYSNAHSRDKIVAVVNECQEWWFEHCLYLDAEARQAFREAYHAAISHSNYLIGSRDVERAERSFERILKAGAAIERAVELPSIGISEEESKELKKVYNKAATSGGA